MCVFRPMTKADAVTVHALEKSLFKSPWPEESFTKEPFTNNNLFAFVAEIQHTVVGYIMGWYVERELHIANIAVSKEFQRRGIGFMLIQKLMEKFDEFEICLLEVRESNFIARKLYRKFGFNEIFIRKAYYHDGENAVIMSKQK